MSRSGIMLAYPFEEKRLAKWSPPYIVQPKLDGERCRYKQYEGGSFLLSSQENVIFGAPHIKSYLDSFCPGGLHLDGELYCHGMSFETIVSIASRERDLHSEYNNLEYHVFDLINSEPQMVRLIQLSGLKELFRNSPIKVVDFYLCNTLDEIMQRYDQILNEGYEGMIVRECSNFYTPKRSTSMMKFKPKKSDQYEIVGYCEEISIHNEPKNALGALVCQGDDGTRFNVGTGFTREQREQLWKNKEYLIGSLCNIQYQHLTHGNGVPRFPVFVRII